MVSISDDTKTIRAVERSLAIVETLRELEAATVGEVAAELGISKSSAHSHLATLQREGYVVRRGDRHELSLTFLSHGEFVRGQVPLFNVIKRYSRMLADETGENVSFIVEEEGECVFVYCDNRNHELPDARAGTRVPIHCMSAGKAILAELPDERIQQILRATSLDEFTDNTIVDEADLFDEIDEIRDRGFAINRGERIERQQSVAVAVTDGDSRLIGALAVVGPKHRLKEDRLSSEIPDALLVAAEKIELKSLSG